MNKRRQFRTADDPVKKRQRRRAAGKSHRTARSPAERKPLRLVAYCGLYCGLCAQCCRIPRRASSLRDALRLEGYEYWGGEIPGFEPFWKFLDNLAESESRHSCRDGSCGPSGCEIRKCARAKGVDVCVFCDQYPCRRIRSLARRYPVLLADAQRMKQIGIGAWIEEQEARRRSGFAYADIRCHPK